MTDRIVFADLVEDVRALYASEHGRMGGCLHIVLDDGNIRDSDVTFCVEWAEQRGCESCADLARRLLQASQRTRLRLHRAPR